MYVSHKQARVGSSLIYNKSREQNLQLYEVLNSQQQQANRYCIERVIRARHVCAPRKWEWGIKRRLTLC